MPSPFPGVDPYLEAQGLWPDFHNNFIQTWRESLLQVLPEDYDARTEERICIVQDHGPEERTIIPDVAVEQLPDWGSGGGTATPIATETQGMVLTLALPRRFEVRESFIHILKRPERSLVAVLEVLSATNKGSERPLYLRKRDTVLSTSVHLVELDLLLGGYRLPFREPLPPAHYYAFISASEMRPVLRAHCWGVRDRLPTIAIPLAEPGRHVTSDLQQVWNTAYDRGGYPRAVDYSQELPWKFTDSDREWVRQHAAAGAKR